jgi:uncharacterized protein YecE (DUF72 family)
VEDQQSQGRLYLGCPVWACEHWKGELYEARAPRTAWLTQYSRVFNTVEGNSTFYGLPALETVARWADTVESDFRFALKVPRAISHESRLRGAARELSAFLAVAGLLAERGCLGPSFLQLPPDFTPAQWPQLETFLRGLPTSLPWAVEVRHADWYDSGHHEQRLDALLSELGIGKVLLDSRPLYSQPARDASEQQAQLQKPQTPHRTTVCGQYPFLRLIGRNRIEETQPWIDSWSDIIAGWLAAGKQPYIFTHAPDDRYAPQVARQLHAAVRERYPALPAQPLWPGQHSPAPQQLRLF